MKSAPPKNRRAITPPKPQGKRVETALLALALMAMTLAAYWPALHGGPVMDDDMHIYDNKTLQSLSGLWAIWFSPHETAQYYPLSFTGFWIGYHLWGFNPLGYHLLNVGLHGLVAVCLWQVLGRLQVRGAWLAGAIFALHPVNVMSVAWMSELKNTLSAALALGSIWAYVKFAGLGVYALTPRKGEVTEGDGRKPPWRYYVLALGLFQCALLAKTAVSFVPLTLLLIVWWQRGRAGWREVWPLIPMLGIAVMMGAVTIYVERHWGGAAGESFELAFLDRVLVSGRSFWFYLGKLVWPYPLTFIYPRWEINAAVWWQYAYPAATVGLLAGLWMLRRRIGRWPIVAMLHFYVCTSMLVLLVMLSMMSITWVCDHWQYFGCMSVLAMMATGIFRAVEWISRGRPFLRPVLGGILLLSLGLLTRLQCGIYADSETIWEKTIVRNPDSWLVQYNLGVAMAARRKLDGAVEHYERALELKPDYADGHNSLGILLAVRGESDAAILHYERALQLKPDFAKAHSNLGVALGSQGKWDAAIPHFKKALALKPDHVTACHYLGKALAAQGKHDEAVQYFRQALDLAEAQHNPALAETIRNQLQLYEAGLPTP